MQDKSDYRIYQRDKSIVFRKTHEKFGGLSNMACGYSLSINGVYIRTSEALYQACRFPDSPEIQKIIIEQASPMTAKMKSKLYKNRTREDWEDVRVRIMKWCIRVKLAQNWSRFGSLLESTKDYPIVEESLKDDFWGAKPIDDIKLIGVNVLGRSLMELRSEYLCFKGKYNYILRPPSIEKFLFLGGELETICVMKNESSNIRNPVKEHYQLGIFDKCNDIV